MFWPLEDDRRQARLFRFGQPFLATALRAVDQPGHAPGFVARHAIGKDAHDKETGGEPL